MARLPLARKAAIASRSSWTWARPKLAVADPRDQALRCADRRRRARCRRARRAAIGRSGSSSDRGRRDGRRVGQRPAVRSSGQHRVGRAMLGRRATPDPEPGAQQRRSAERRGSADHGEKADDETAHGRMLHTAAPLPRFSRTARGGAAGGRPAPPPSSPRRPARRGCRRRDRGGPWSLTSTSLPWMSTRAPRRQDRARRLDREAHDDVLPGRDAAEDAAGVVGQERDLAVPHAHLVGILLAAKARRRRSRRRSRRP